MRNFLTRRLSWSIVATCLEGRGIVRYIWTKTIEHVGLLRDERSEKGDDRWTLRDQRDTHCIPDPRARERGSSSSNHQLPIRRGDSWKHGSRSKISGPSMAPPPRPYMATSRAYTRLLWKRDIENERKRGEKKGNNNNRSLLGTSWSRARSSSWNLSTNNAIGSHSRNHYSRNGESLHRRN